jgi:glutathione-independent formaldehyde dehydrogenase
MSTYLKERLAQAASFGCETIDLSRGGTLGEQIEQILKVPEVDCAIDCVGFEAKQRDEAAKAGNLSLHFGLGWAKSHTFFTGQTPVLRYNRALMMAILHDRIKIAKAVNTTVISLDAAPQSYAEFDKGVARKFIIDPHGTLKHHI